MYNKSTEIRNLFTDTLNKVTQMQSHAPLRPATSIKDKFATGTSTIVSTYGVGTSTIIMCERRLVIAQYQNITHNVLLRKTILFTDAVYC